MDRMLIISFLGALVIAMICELPMIFYFDESKLRQSTLALLCMLYITISTMIGGYLIMYGLFASLVTMHLIIQLIAYFIGRRY